VVGVKNGVNKVEAFVSHDFIGRLMIQCARQPGLASVLDTLLGFEGSEFYLKNWPALTGQTFEHALFSFKDAAIVGIRSADNSVVINPADNYVIKKDDKVIAIAEDNNSYTCKLVSDKELERFRQQGRNLPDFTLPAPAPEKILFVGWRRDIHDMVIALDQYCSAGTQLHMFTMHDEDERNKELDAGYKVRDITELKNITITHKVGNQASRRELNDLDMHTYDSVLILAENTDPEYPQQMVDSKSLVSLVLIRDIHATKTAEATAEMKDLTHLRKFNLISEILDNETKDLVTLATQTDYVASNALISKVLAMIAEDQDVGAVLSDLLAAEGSEIYVKDYRLYVTDQEAKAATFEMLLARGRARSNPEVVIGYITPGETTLEAKVNPTDKDQPCGLCDGSFVIVLSPDAS